MPIYSVSGELNKWAIVITPEGKLGYGSNLPSA